MNVATHITTHITLHAGVAEQRLLAALRQAGAVSPQAAAELSVESPLDESCLKALISRRAIVQSAPGRYFIDEAAITARDQKQRRVRRRVLALLLVGIGLVAFGVYLLS